MRNNFFIVFSIIIKKKTDIHLNIKKMMVPTKDRIKKTKDIILHDAHEFDKEINNFKSIYTKKRELKTLKSGNNDITRVFVDFDKLLFPYLCKSLKTTSHVTNITFAYEYLDFMIIYQFAKVLAVNTSIKIICMENQMIRDRGALLMAIALKNNSTVETINMKNISIYPHGFNCISEALCTNSSIKNLDMSDNGYMFPTKDYEYELKFTETLKLNSTIESINFSDCRISDINMCMLSEGLKYNSTIKNIILHHNEIGDDGFIEFARKLRTNSSIQKLNLCNNNIGDRGLIELSEALISNPSININDLDISYNKITNESMLKLRDALWFNTSIKKIDITHNCINSKGIDIIVDVLITNRTIECFYFANSPFQSLENKSGQKLVKILENNFSLKKMMNDECGIDYYTRDTLKALLNRNYDLSKQQINSI